MMYVIDPHFREQFEIARPTPSYQGLLASIPDVVVLTEDQCIKLVQLLCHELGECFKQASVMSSWRDDFTVIAVVMHPSELSTEEKASRLMMK